MREIIVHSDLVLSLKYVSEVKRESKIASDKLRQKQNELEK